MPITIPDKTKVRPTIDYKHIPCEAVAALTNPGPVSVPATGSASSGAILVEAAANVAGRTGYVGFNVMSDIAAGAAPSVVRNTIIEGLAGMTPGSRVYIADDGTLTHTKDLEDTGNGIGTAGTATKLVLD